MKLKRLRSNLKRLELNVLLFDTTAFLYFFPLVGVACFCDEKHITLAASSDGVV